MFDMDIPLSQYSKTCLKQPLKRRPKIVFKTDYPLLQVESTAIPSTCFKLTSVFKTFVLYILSGRLRQVLLYMVNCVKKHGLNRVK